jgi:epoxyqueuosine reductase QueG
LRNIALAMGNALRGASESADAVAAMRMALSHISDHESEVVREQVAWALA